MKLVIKTTSGLRDNPCHTLFLPFFFQLSLFFRRVTCYEIPRLFLSLFSISNFSSSICIHSCSEKQNTGRCVWGGDEKKNRLKIHLKIVCLQVYIVCLIQGNVDTPTYTTGLQRIFHTNLN